MHIMMWTWLRRLVNIVDVPTGYTHGSPNSVLALLSDMRYFQKPHSHLVNILSILSVSLDSDLMASERSCVPSLKSARLSTSALATFLLGP